MELEVTKFEGTGRVYCEARDCCSVRLYSL